MTEDNQVPSNLKYPIYRRYNLVGEYIGGIYGKLNSDGSSVIVRFAFMDQRNFRIQHFADRSGFDELYGEDFIDSNRDEFEKAYGKAQFLLTKANNEQ